MNRKQWWAFAILFLTASIFFLNLSFAQQKIQINEALRFIDNIKDWIQIYNQTTGVPDAPEIGEHYVTSLISSRLYMSFAVITLLIFFACMISAYFQKTPIQEWAEVELAKHDFKFNIELSEMPIKKREEFLEGYYKTLMDISKGKKSLGENVEETKRRALENVKKEDSKKK